MRIGRIGRGMLLLRIFIRNKIKNRRDFIRIDSILRIIKQRLRARRIIFRSLER